MMNFLGWLFVVIALYTICNDIGKKLDIIHHDLDAHNAALLDMVSQVKDVLDSIELSTSSIDIKST